MEGDKEFDGQRDSHDLSIRENGTRDSVVDNMLLSLDQFSSGPLFTTTTFDTNDFFLADNNNPYPPPRTNHRQRGHVYASSQSSDYDMHPDDASSRISGHQPRGRRSNSSNNIHASMSRKSSLRGYPGLGMGNKQSSTMFGDVQQTHTRGSGKKSSKGSTSSSMDFGHAGILGTHRFGFGNRSASFDQSNLPSGIVPSNGESILDRSRPIYQDYNEYEPAPQPIIHAGPRRVQERELLQSPLSQTDQPQFAPPQAPVVRRKNSVRSTAGRTLRKNKSQPEQNMRLQAQEFVNANSVQNLQHLQHLQHLQNMPPMPAFQDPPAPAPTVATRKYATPTPSTPVSNPKEKPGFFRRMFSNSSKTLPQLAQFSSSSNNSNLSHVDVSPASSHNRPTDVNSIYSREGRPQTTPNSSHHIASQLKSLPRVPQTANSGHKEPDLPTLPTLAKKHSSFFRRRKKSVTDNGKPPIMSVDFKPPPKQEVSASQASPGVSSLRRVMNPYLSSPMGGPGESFQKTMGEAMAGVEEHGSGFSPGYKPHADAMVRSVKPDSRGSRSTNTTPPSSRGEQLNASRALNKSSPRLKLKMQVGRGEAHDGSFLADSSSCNEDSGRATPSGDRSALGKSDGETSGGKNFGGMLKPQQTTRAESAQSISRSASEVEDDDGWVLTPRANDNSSHRQGSSNARRVWLEPTSSEESLPLEGTRTQTQDTPSKKPSPRPLQVTTTELPTPSSVDDVFHSASSVPVVQVDSRESVSDDMPALIEVPTVPDDDEPTEAERERAFRIFNNDEASVTKAQVATVLGDVSLPSVRIRKAYMELFDWSGFSILAAMRDLCGKLVLKAESQQVDRILMSLSERWCECNPNHGFKATDVVHTICYSLLLLNTDLHVAELDSRMTRNQFVKNTLPTVVRVCQAALKDAGEETLRPQSMARRGSLPWNKSEPNSPAADTDEFPGQGLEEPLENRRARSRLSLRPAMRSGSEGFFASEDANPLVNSSYNGPMKGWELQLELVLKDFYNSIRQQRLPLYGSSNLRVHEQPSSNNLSVGGMLRRTPSVLSKAPSENLSYRGRSTGDFKSVGNRWVTKTRSRPRLYPNSTVASSRTSLDDGSVFSPAGSSTWSRYSFGKTGTSMSMESLGSHFAQGDYQQAIGFANALSQAIIREEGMTLENTEEITRVAPLLEDETLELAGAPWAKEGILKHKHHLEALDKKAKDRTWNECFAVIEKGYMRLFSFNMNSKSMRLKNKSRPSTGSVVGGGNWMDNAEALDSFLLRQSIASALPPPGYSKNRPHVFALSLPTGAVHLFQVGTPDIVREFVSTANYWSARLSKEPLMGGVSNIEYGWGENVINPALIIRNDSTPSAKGHVPRPSMASSLRSSVDHATGSIKPRLPGDKVTLSDWSPPAQSMMASNLMEIDQLKALTDYVKNVEEELSRHNELRAPMLIAFSPRHPNAAKAMTNWERKSAYLLREIVKFRTYIDSLTAAQCLKDKIYAKREADNVLAVDSTGESATRNHSINTETDGGSEAPASYPQPVPA